MPIGVNMSYECKCSRRNGARKKRIRKENKNKKEDKKNSR